VHAAESAEPAPAAAGAVPGTANRLTYCPRSAEIRGRACPASSCPDCRHHFRGSSTEGGLGLR
jgi:hypothetical protein